MDINMSDAKEYLDSVTKEGKVITVNIKIQDSEKAQQLMGTMYEQNTDKFGVEVQSWGFWDIQKANKLRMDAIDAETERYYQNMQSIKHKTDLDYLSECYSELSGLDMPIANLSSVTKYWWSCTQCKLNNENSFLGSVPKTIECQACKLEHKAS